MLVLNSERGDKVARVSQNIYYNIDDSNLSVTYEELTFFFSSDVNMNKFIKRRERNLEEKRWLVSARYIVQIDTPNLYDLMLYVSIEKRGFKVITREGEVVRCLEFLKLGGEIKTKQKSED